MTDPSIKLNPQAIEPTPSTWSEKMFAVKARLFVGLLALSGLFLVASDCSAQWIEKADLVGPYIDEEPFDLLTLNEEGDGAIFKIIPQKTPPTKPLPDRGMLVFEFAVNSEDILQVPFASVATYQTFNELLIEEANGWLRNDEYSKAFRNLLYVYDHGGKSDPDLVKSLRSCLFQDGKANFINKEYELALSIFEDIYRRDPSFKYPGIDAKLIDIIMNCYDGMIKKQFDASEYIEVQRSVASIEEKYGQAAGALVNKWKQAFDNRADDLMALSRKHARDGNGRQAHLASRQAEQMSPGRADIKELQEEILKAYSLIVMGVSQASDDADPQRIEHWGSRRTGRATRRTIVEMSGLSDEGGKYVFLNGELYRADEAGLEYVFELKPESETYGTPQATPFQISSRLNAAASVKDSQDYNQEWAKVLQSIKIQSNKVMITLRTPFIRPEALMSFSYSDPVEGEAPEQNGIYVVTGKNDEWTTLELNPSLEPIENAQTPVVIEQLYRSASDATDDLIKGSIDMVDRIPPADIGRLKATRGIIVRPYLLPTVHMLIPKIRGELKDNDNFRSGLSHAINRESIVQNVICDGEEVSGCEVLSGPFPIGTEENDQISYGYDLNVKPAAFNTKLGMVLVELALRPTKERKEKLKAPSLVIAHTRSSTAAQGAEAIARMWGDIGVIATTRELGRGESVPSDDLWDFLYLEVVMEEPLADAASVIGETGFATDISAPAEQSMRTLSYSQSWRTACATLRRLHRQVSVDLSIVPLWQVKEHYAYRNTVRGIGRGLIHLYQNVDRWQIDTYGSDEQE